MSCMASGRKGRVDWGSGGKRILYVQYANPAAYPSLEHSSRMLAEAGWLVRFRGVRISGSEPLAFPPHPRIRVRQIQPREAGWRQKLHYLWFFLGAVAEAVVWRPRWVYASDLYSVPVALALSFLPSIGVVYHEHDSPPSRGHTRFTDFCLTLRHKLARKATVCIVPNAGRARHFSREVAGGRQVHTVWNCPRTNEVYPPKSPREGRLKMLYHGSVVPTRLPLTVIQALALLPPVVELLVVGYETTGTRGYVGELLREAVRLKVADRVEYRGTVPRHALLDICYTCDVGLCLVPLCSGDANFQSMTGASVKPFDYMACGLPLLVSDIPEWHEMYVESGYGLACNPEDPLSIAAALGQYLERPELLRHMGAQGQRRILSQWNYEAEFSEVFHLLEAEQGVPCGS
jgi:glycosyltransferase involved in cell wall biosynthesis